MQNMIDRALVSPLSLLPVPMGRQMVGGQDRSQTMSLPQASGARQLFIDVSVISREDARTGIQRVVRALLLHLAEKPPPGWTIRLVRASKYQGYRLAPDVPGLPSVGTVGGQPLRVNCGDVFLGLDLAAHLVPRHLGQLARWKKQGATLLFMVYDLLPLLEPQWFNPRTQKHFARWLRSVALLADGAICISRSVQTELQQYLVDHFRLPPQSIDLHHIHLGADLHASAPSQGLPQAFESRLQALGERPTVLMVGTLEPRKGHAQAIAAFEILWAQGFDVNLVIAGKPGWKIDGLLSGIQRHPQLGHRLHWFDHPSDEALDALYRRASGALMASEAEGFGLPLVEAASYGKPVLARDIPVFREVGANAAAYFEGVQPASLAAALKGWLPSLTTGDDAASHLTIPWQTWAQSAQQLVACLSCFEPQR
jgi:glycosyltransferase involved in cell wall biosynthesis